MPRYRPIAGSKSACLFVIIGVRYGGGYAPGSKAGSTGTPALHVPNSTVSIPIHGDLRTMRQKGGDMTRPHSGDMP